jgi:methanogenic corrinoid protein MtbC1
MSGASDLANVGAEISRQAPLIAEDVVTRQYALQPGLWEKYGARGRALSVRDVNYHLPFLTAAIEADDAELFAQYVGWLRILFASLGLDDAHTVATLTCMRDVILEHLSPGMGATAVPYLDAGLAEMRAILRPVAAFLDDDGRPFRPLARMYLEALLRGDRHVASNLVLESVERGADLHDVYLCVLQDVQHEVGRLWMTNRISVAKEHFCTAVTLNVTARLYPRIMSVPKTGKRIVVACAGGERHELGARMVADFFELDGWDAIYLGADTPASAVDDAVREHAPHVLGISANMTFNLASVRDVIVAARAADKSGQMKTLVGGYQFNANPGLWQKTGADAWACDGREAVAVAKSLAGRG